MKLMLIDGNSLTYRAFFAIPTDLATASGQVTNAVFGFTSMLANLMRDRTPDGIAVALSTTAQSSTNGESIDGVKAETLSSLRKNSMNCVRSLL